MECPKWITENGFEYQLQVNYLSHYLLTRLFIDYKSSIQSASAATMTELRIINVTSTLYKCKYSILLIIFFSKNFLFSFNYSQYESKTFKA
jgi:hypothetical protein